MNNIAIYKVNAKTINKANVKSNNKGFTLIELIIALAIIAAIGGTAAVYFTATTDKARLKSDIQSAQIIESAIELYSVEQGASISETDVYSVIGKLADAGYLRRSDYKEQLDGAEWVIIENEKKQKKVYLNIDGYNGGVKSDIYNTLTENEKLYVINAAGGTGGTGSAGGTDDTDP